MIQIPPGTETMDETWIVQGATAGQIVDWLDELAQLARDEKVENPLRPQTAVAGAAAVEVGRLPLPARSRASHAGAIYARWPSPAEPFGVLLVLALIEEKEAGVLRAEIASDPRFPIAGEEVMWHFRNRFPHCTRGAGGRRTGLLLWINRLARSSHTGAPVLACNVWLEEQLAKVHDERERMRLFRPWMARYRELRGVEPADPMRSFRAAVAGCERRLRARSRGGAPAKAGPVDEP